MGLRLLFRYGRSFPLAHALTRLLVVPFVTAALAEKTGQCSGAEVRGICQEAGMYALRERRQHVTQDDFEMAVSKVLKRHQDGNTSSSKLFT